MKTKLSMMQSFTNSLSDAQAACRLWSNTQLESLRQIGSGFYYYFNSYYTPELVPVRCRTSNVRQTNRR